MLKLMSLMACLHTSPMYSAHVNENEKRLELFTIAAA